MSEAATPGAAGPATPTAPAAPAALAATPPASTPAAPAIDMTALAAAVAQALGPLLKPPTPPEAPPKDAPPAEDPAAQAIALERRLAEERRGRERAELEATQALIRLHVGPVKQPGYLALAPKVERGADGQLTDESRAKLDEWKRTSGELFALAPPTTTPAGAPATATGPTFTAAALAWQARNGIDPAKLAERAGAGTLIPLLGHNSKDLSLAEMASRGAIGGVA